MYRPRDRIIGTICLGYLFVADEDHLSAMILQLLLVRRRVLHIHDAPKRLQVMYRRLLPIPHLERGLPFHSLRWHPVQEVHGSVHCLSPELGRQPLCLQQAARGANYRRVSMLDDAVLLWGVRRRQLPVHTVCHAILHELLGYELATAVCPEHQQLAAGLRRYTCLELLDGCRCPILGRQ